MHTIWRTHPADPPRAGRLAEELGIDPITAQCLLNRGVQDRAQGERFLDPRVESLGDPFELPDMERGIRRLRQAIAHREPILLFSDSDVDGVTASVILYEVLRSLGAVVRARISNRIADGYGLPRSAVHAIARSTAKLLILVDCGTNQPEEVHLLAVQGIDTIILDHHVPLDGWAEPYALINPHRSDGAGRPPAAPFGTSLGDPAIGGVPRLGRPPAAPFGTSLGDPAIGGVPRLGRELCSAGLALKVAQALLDGDAEERLAPYLDLAALGTLADCAPVVGDNRAILVEGMPRIVRSRRPGLQRLCEETRTVDPDPDRILRRLTPRLNASGRLGDATAVWKLLLVDGDGRIDEWLAMTKEAHAQTRQLHRRIMAEAHEQVNRLHFRDQFVMVVSRQGWHQGLMGPLAAQLAERYGRPAIAIAMDGCRGVGSGRSIPLFNLLKALQACEGLLVRFGGHAQACGLTVDQRHLEDFRARVNQQAGVSLGREGLLRTRTADLELPLAAVQPRWVEEAERLAPFGRGNPRPMVLIRHVAISAVSPRTARLSDGTVSIVGKGRFEGLVSGALYSVVASPALVEKDLVLTVSDVRGATAPWGRVQPSGTRCTPAVA